MSLFLRLLDEADKAQALTTACVSVRHGENDDRCFEVTPNAFDAVPGKPFAYWVSDSVRETFTRLEPLESEDRTITKGAATSDNFRFIRLAWECHASARWVPCAKGGSYSPMYSDVFLLINWEKNAAEMEAEVVRKYPYLKGDADWVLHRESSYFEPGLTWPLRSQRGFGMRAMPAGCVFGHKGPALAIKGGDSESLLSCLAITTSRPFSVLVELQMAFGSYEVGVIRRTPVPKLTSDKKQHLAMTAHRAWSLKRTLDSIDEISHAYLLPASLRSRLGDYDVLAIQTELGQIQAEIDEIAFELYRFSKADRHAALNQTTVEQSEDGEAEDDEDEESYSEVTSVDALLSWAVGVAFGRFDWRLATGERAMPAEPEPFEPLPAKSSGMLPDGAASFHGHAGILGDDKGHPHDLARLAEEVLARVDVTVPDDVRRWLQRDFFAFHLQRYSKSRRKAPIYWPLSTTSSSYTLWVYYPSLTSQTLYTAINDFVEPKLKQVGSDVTALRNKGSARTRDDEKQFEALQAFELELIELRDTLLKLAPTYKPNHDDGVQISAAPLWPLFRHKPWQKVLKDTWAKLEKGDYDWGHLAMNYWPERVREKCKTDKSLAIAHGLEDLYIEPEAKPKKARGKKSAGGDE